MTVEALQQDNTALKSQIGELSSHNAKLHSQIGELKLQIAQLQKLIFGSKRERFDSNVSNEQLNLFDVAESEEFVEEPIVEVSYTRKKNNKHEGRNELPKHLPVEVIILEPEIKTTGMVKIGEQITETLDYQPASLKIIRKVRPKYADKSNDQIHIASLPESPFPKCMAEVSLLAHILVSKFIDHLPYYRQIQRFKRDYQWIVSSSTINNWMAACCTLLKPLYEHMMAQVLESDYIQADESPIKVLDPDKKGTSHLGYQWVYYALKKGLVIFHYRRGRGMHGPKEFLMNFSGYLQCDGYPVYDKIGRRKKEIILIGCLVHARRKFYDAQKSDPQRGKYAMGIFNQIYKIERELKNLPKEERQKGRLSQIKPLMYQLLKWIEKECVIVPPKSAIGKAMRYYQNQWPKLQNILVDADIELDNNLIENKIRPLALGRKNYLFAGSDRGAEWAAMMYSFFGTCKIHDVNPYEWLVAVMNRIGFTSIQDLDQFLPQNWEKQQV